MIRRGVWHQFGDRSQKLVLEQLQNGVGVGVIISPRDLKLELAEGRCTQYRALGSDALLDYQFYVPDFNNRNISTYSLDNFRNSVNTLNQVTQPELDALSTTLEDHNRRLCTVAVLAPAVLYEANRPERLDLNRKLFEAAKRAGDALGIPTIATVALAHSTVISPQSISDALAHATALPCDGWYYLFEFGECRIPFERSEVWSCGSACLTLATNLKPVIHAYAGPMALLSFGFGATAACIGHSQTLWQFDRARWPLNQPEQQGGPGEVAPRFFSEGLWGTIIYSDEVIRMPLSLREQVMTHSPYSQLIADPATHGAVKWAPWDAGKHLVHVIGIKAGDIAAQSSARAAARAAIEHLDRANGFFQGIAGVPVPLKPESQNLHQRVWREVLEQLLAERADDYDLLEMMTP